MAELPSGAVTFLFTDIAGSTQLVKQLRGLYGNVLAEHQRLLREAFAAHEGHEIDTQGDAFFIAFASAREAVLAAVEGQRALSGYPWPDNAPVQVRMGIHTGQAVPVNGRYTGVAVHRASRICNAGHGGQVLISQATQTLLEDEEEDLEVGLRDLGQQRLKDLDRPVQLYQIAAPGLAAQFPPLREEAPPESTVAPVPLYRRPMVLVGTGLALLAVIAAVVLLTTRSGGGGLAGVQPNHVGIIDPESGDIVGEVEVGVRPGPVAVGGGTVWVGDQDARTLTQIEAGTREKAPTITLENRTPTGIAADETSVWVANGLQPDGSLQRIDPQFDRVTDTVPDADAGSVTLGEGAVWTALNSALARINPSTGRVTERSFAGPGDNGIVVGEGAVWVSNEGDSTVFRFNPDTFESGEVDFYNVGQGPVAIAFGEGAVWTANAGGDNVSRIDPAGGGVDSLDVGDNPTAIAVGGGAVWVANGDEGTISKIDPAEFEVVDTIETGNYPAGLAFGEGFLWVTVQEPLAPVG